jgi:hypothetical protein
MADDHSKTALHRQTISVETLQQVRAWMTTLGCTESELRLAVRAVGHSAVDVRAYLAKRH